MRTAARWSSGLFLKQASPAIRLAVAPATGHLVNLEEPDLLHRLTEDFFVLVEFEDMASARPVNEKLMKNISVSFVYPVDDGLARRPRASRGSRWSISASPLCQGVEADRSRREVRK